MNGYKSIDVIYNKYLCLKKIVAKDACREICSVIGHGDPCFANTLYNKMTRTILYIDPKGADTEEKMWTDPYYDIAKLSHSVYGLYDYFNAGMFNIQLSESFKYIWKIMADNHKYKEIINKNYAKMDLIII